MSNPARQVDAAAHPLLRGICLVVKGGEQRARRQAPVTLGTVAKLPKRPDGRVLSESIPLFFIGRNTNGFWVAREAEGRAAGIFLFERSALHFARRSSAPAGCATMFVTERLELDVENQGNPLIGWLNAAMRMASQRRLNHTTPQGTIATVGRRRGKGEPQ